MSNNNDSRKSPSDDNSLFSPKNQKWWWMGGVFILLMIGFFLFRYTHSSNFDPQLKTIQKENLKQLKTLGITSL